MHPPGRSSILLAIFSVLAWSLLVTGSAPAPDPGLTAHWSFDDPADDTLTDHASGTVLDLSGGASSTGPVLELCHGCYATVRTPPAAFTDQTMSISFWFRPRSSPAAGTLLNGTVNSTTVQAIHIDNDGVLRFQRRRIGRLVTTDSIRQRWEAGRWYHIVAQSKVLGLQLFIDGELVSEQSTLAKELTDTRLDRFRLGGFPGSIDDLRVHDHHLNRDRITELMQDPPPA